MLPDDPQAIDLIPFNPPIPSSQEREEGRNEKEWTFEKVEARLIEAAAVARRLPDRERGWLSVKAFWPSIVRERCLGDYDALGYLGTSEDAPPARMPLTRAELVRMEAASGWVGMFLDDEGDRRLLALALGWKAAGRRVGWRKVKAALGAGVGEVALARRYDRIIATICCMLSGKGRGAVSQMMRGRMARASREAAARSGGAGASAVRGRSGRRRRIEVDIVYS